MFDNHLIISIVKSSVMVDEDSLGFGLKRFEDVTFNLFRTNDTSMNHEKRLNND